MGCDIHVFSEVRTPTGWVCQQEPEEDGEDIYLPNVPSYGGRNYPLFALLAGVRGEFAESWEPRGFPDDSSKEVAESFDFWDSDAHTPSHQTLGELQRKAAELLIRDKPNGSNIEYAFNGLTTLIRAVKDSLGNGTNLSDEDVRIVYWFDN